MTARRRDEGLLEVPFPVTVLRDAEQQPFIRAMSVNSFFQGSQKASFVHDGIFVGCVARKVGIDDIEQVEVVKDPQGV